MAYAAVTNLTNTIYRIYNFSRLSDLPYAFGTLHYPHDEIEFLKKVIRKLDERSRNRRVKAFFEKIREAAHGLEDLLDSAHSELIQIAQSDSEQHIETYHRWEYGKKVSQGVNFFVETVKRIKEEYKNELKYQLPDEDDDDDDDGGDDGEIESSRTDFCGKKQKMVGSNRKAQITKIKDQLNEGYKSCELRVVSIVGVSSTGRSIYAWTLFHNTDYPYLHKLRALVCVGPKYEFKHILLSILSQVDSNDHKLLDWEGDEKLFEYLHTILKGGDYLIVLDDVQDTRVWEYLKKLFPNENNGSRVLITTPLKEVAVFAQSFGIHPMPILHRDECWNAISEVLFPYICPPELEEAGIKIAQNCEGLLFKVGRYAQILYEVDETLEDWNNVAAEMVINSVANDAYDEMSEDEDLGRSRKIQKLPDHAAASRAQNKRSYI